MAAGDREATFILRASDLSSQPVNQVREALEKLIAQQKAFVEASKAGTANSAEFNKALNDLSKGGQALARQIGDIEKYQKAIEGLQARETALAAAQERRAQLMQQRGAGEITKAEETELKRLEGQGRESVGKLQTAADKFRANTLAPLETQMTRIGVTFATSSDALRMLREMLAATTTGMTEMNAADRVFLENKRNAAAAIKAQAAAEGELADRRKAAAAAEDAENKAFVARNRAAKQAETERFGTPDRFGRLAGGAVDESTRAAEEAKRRKAIREEDIKSAFAEYDVEQRLNASRIAAYAENAQREEALAKQRQMAAQAGAALPGRQPLGVSATPPQDFSSASQGIAGIIAPAATARATITGLEAEIEKLAENLGLGRRKAEEYAADLRTLGLAYEALKKQANLIDLYRGQEEATRRAELAMRQQQAALVALQERIRTAMGAEKGFETELTSVAKAARDATNAFNQENERLAAHRAALDAAGISYINLDAAVVRLNTSAGTGRKVFDELTSKSGGAGGTGAVFLGLRPYELQNLSYQINDVFTQLGSGTSIMQTLSQQGGQIFQLFQKQIVEAFIALKNIPYALSAASVGVAGLTVGILALARAMDLASERRNFAAQLALSVDGARLSIDKMVESAKDIERLGFSLDEASKGARSLAGAGFSQAQISALALLAANLSRASGGTKSFADAIKEVSAAFSGGYDSIRKFVNEYNALDAATAKRIRDALAEGDTEKARTLLFEEAMRRSTEAAEKNTSQLQRFWINTKNGYHDLLDALAKKPANNLEELAGSANKLFDAIKSGMNFIATAGGKIPLPAQPGQTTPQGPAGDVAQREADLTKRLMADLNLTREQASGFSGNIGHESGVQAIQEVNPKSGRGGFGYAQWTGPRREEFEAFAKAQGLDVASDAANYGFLLKELRTKFAHVVDEVRKQTTVEGSTRAALEYESGAKPGQEDPRMVIAMESRLKHAQAAYAGAGGAGATFAPQQTEGVRRATQDFLKEVKDEVNSIHDSTLMGADALRREEEILNDTREKMHERALKFAQEQGQTETERKATTDAIEGYIDAKRREFSEARVKRELGVYNELKGLEEELGRTDKTKLDDRLKAVDDRFQTIRNRITEQFKGIGGAQRVGGKTLEETLADVDKLQQRQREIVTSETAQALVDTVVKRFQDEMKIAGELLRSDLPDKVDQGVARMQRAMTEFGPAMRKAIADSNKALLDLPQTPAIREQLERNQRMLAQSNRPQEVRAFTGEAITQASKEVSDAAKTRESLLAALASEVKAGKKFDDAIRDGLKIIADTGPEIDRTIARVNADLIKLRGATTNPQEKATITAIIAANNAQREKGATELETVITEALKNDQERLTNALEQYNRERAGIIKRERDGIITYARRMQELAELSAKRGPEIEAARNTVLRNTERALREPGLRSGFAQQLQTQATRTAETTDLKVINADTLKANIKDGLDSLNALRDSIRDTEKEQAALTKLGQATTESSEAARRAAYARTNAEAAKIIPTLKAQIDLAEKLGQITPAAATKARAALAEFGAETKYQTKFMEELTKTIESSFEQRAMQAFDTVAQALGNLAAHGGKLKDVWSSLGTAFAEFAAGVLKDIATMIIKFYLLAAVKSMLGIASGGTSIAADAAVGATTAAVKHSGGVVGDLNGATRVVDLSLFRAARRMHDGGIAGDEVTAILQKGEKVLSVAEQRRTTAASSAAQGGGTGIRNVLAVGDHEIASAMNGSHGERVIMNVLQRNAPTVKKWVG